MLVYVVLLFCVAQASAQEPAAETKTVSVSKTYNNAPFDYRIRLESERPEFSVYRLTYPSPVVTALEQNNTVPADYYLPKGISPADAKNYPAVICLHILDGNEPLTELMCSMLAKRGIPAIAFKLPYYGSRGTSKGPEVLASDPKLFWNAVLQAGEDIRRTVDLLASRPEIDAKRIGISGISLGGIIAATAAGAEPRLNRAALILAGGDLPTIIHHARETRPLSLMLQKLPAAERKEVEKKILSADPLQFAPALRERAKAGCVLMINAGDDEVIPHACTEKLANALGIADQVVWFKGLGHYTAVAELPRALRLTADFFAKDLPKKTESADGNAPKNLQPTPTQQLGTLIQQAVEILVAEPAPGRCYVADLESTVAYFLSGKLRIVRGTEGKFSLYVSLPKLGEISMGQGRYPWMIVGQKDKKMLLVGTKGSATDGNPFLAISPENQMKLRVARGAAESVALVPEMLSRWIDISRASENKTNGSKKDASKLWNNKATEIKTSGFVIKFDKATAQQIAQRCGHSTGNNYYLNIRFQDDYVTPVEATFMAINDFSGGILGTLKFNKWQLNAPADAAMFEPPAGLDKLERKEVAAADLQRIFAAAVNFGLEYITPGRHATANLKETAISVVARDPAGHGLLCRTQGKTILMVAGTPRQMGAAQGALLREPAQELTERVVYLVGGGDTLNSGTWFFDRMSEIERRTTPHIPPRFIEECNALSAAVGVSPRDGLYANLFPERFHCSGIALRGKATAGGRVLHARVLDYMRDIDLQRNAVVQVFMPEGRFAWISHGYAGFIGTVTAMNEKGVAIGEMGGRGEGQWDGMPMSLLLRDVMERAATADEAVAIMRAAPRTCEYYYVVSDRSGAIRGLECRPNEMKVLQPGQQDPRLAHMPEDTVLVSGEDRSKVLSQRVMENYGRIDVPKLVEIIKRPVSMQSNLHDAIFAPATLEMWCSDAGRNTPACDEPYAHVNLRELIEFYQRESR